LTFVGLAFFVQIKETQSEGRNWAVLVAGSNGYSNYRHQSDVSHAYQILVKLGNFAPENIIVMMYNDIAYNSYNPYPGQLYNEPNGTNVYEGVQIAYNGSEVNSENFFRVLKQIPDGTDRPILQSTFEDNVFIYYSDHGATGLVSMPVGDPIFADDLIEAFVYMYEYGMYNQLVFYLEACESGSMFANILPPNMSIFATTAANPKQSSYAIYYNDTIGTYLGDEYSVRWMQDSTVNWENWESLIQQFTHVKNAVEMSQPQKYGDYEFDTEYIQDFQGYDERSPTTTRINTKTFSKDYFKPSYEYADSRDVTLQILQHHYLKATTISQKKHYSTLIENEINHRLKVDELFLNLTKTVSNVDNDMINGHLLSLHLTPHNFECLKQSFNYYSELCEPWSDYSLKYVHSIVTLCEIYGSESVLDSLEMLCIQEENEQKNKPGSLNKFSESNELNSLNEANELNKVNAFNKANKLNKLSD